MPYLWHGDPEAYRCRLRLRHCPSTLGDGQLLLTGVTLRARGGIYGQPGRDAHRIQGAPGKEWTSVENEAMGRRQQGEPKSPHHAASIRCAYDASFCLKISQGGVDRLGREAGTDLQSHGSGHTSGTNQTKSLVEHTLLDC